MDDQTFSDTVERLKRVNEVISGLDEAIRADAFKLLKAYIAQGREPDEVDEGENEASANAAETKKRTTGTVDIDELIEAHASDTEADNAKLALAVYFHLHGRGPFQMSELKSIADKHGLTTPNRFDMTFKRTKHDGKPVIRKQADGYKTTPIGAAWLKETYGVTQGKPSRST